MRRRVLILVNPAAASGRALAAVQRVTDSLRSHGFDCQRAHSAQGGHLTELARTLAPSCDLMVAVGGDGTVREVASGLLQAGAPDTVLGVLPGGTGNDFATQLGIADAEAALAALRGGQPRAVDVIEVRHSDGPSDRVDHALLFAATGFAVELLRLTGPRVKRWFGKRFSYSVGFFRALAGFRAPRMRLHVDGREFTGPRFHVCAGNSEWAGGGAMRLSPGAQMDDGRLEFCLIEALGRCEALRCFPMLLRGTFPGHPKVRYFGGRELSVATEPPAPLALDGDVVGRTPATFRVLPGALRVLVPTLSWQPHHIRGRVLGVPRNIRQLVADLEAAGFVLVHGGKGSHRKFRHPKVRGAVILCGQGGDDAKHYQERQVRHAIQEARK